MKKTISILILMLMVSMAASRLPSNSRARTDLPASPLARQP